MKGTLAETEPNAPVIVAWSGRHRATVVRPCYLPAGWDGTWPLTDEQQAVVDAAHAAATEKD